jgi:6-phosphogluconolactonase (cycloisomerase 2 family)
MSIAIFTALNANMAPAVSAKTDSFVLFAYDWNSAQNRDRDSLQAFPTLKEAEEAYKGEQDAAEIAIIRNGALTVISRGFVNRNITPRQVQWSREIEWINEAEDEEILLAAKR